MFLYTLYAVTGEPIGQTPLMGQAIRAAIDMLLPTVCPAWWNAAALTPTKPAACS